MIVHPSESRGKADHGWLNSHHTFSFADYYDPERMGHGVLRVINDDSVEAGMGFGLHPHRDMEIISIPLEGALAHKDSEGNSHIIKKGDVQIMSAGTGIFHSEMNASSDDKVKFLQIWVKPKQLAVTPRYEQKTFLHEGRHNKFCLIVSPDGREGSVTINQDAFFSLVDLEPQTRITYKNYISANGIYIFVLSGEIEVEGKCLGARDGLAVNELSEINMKLKSKAEVLLMEVPV